MLPFWPDQALLLYVCHEYEKSAREDQANREATSNVYWSIWDGSKQNWVVDGSDAKSTALNGHNARKQDNNTQNASARWRFWRFYKHILTTLSLYYYVKIER